MATPYGYAFLPGVWQYSTGVIALRGYRLIRVQFRAPVPLDSGLRRAADIISASGQPPGALCACELRMPAPLDEDDFISFNRRYLVALAEIGTQLHNGGNPVARTNVSPARNELCEPSLHAFSFASPSHRAAGDFIVSGSAEVPEGLSNYRDNIVARGDVSAHGLRAKADFVLAEMGRRMGALAVSGEVPQAVQVYSVHDVHDVLAGSLATNFAPPHGVTWHQARPPVAELDYEMDCRTVSVERLEDACS
ncbi:MAG: hypothetical protein DLM59_11255 [Pseudonocardiales bacterium]|nr:MAG: hypothetical protein DLM59_11255 [Pseudonocardiales bacterium]